METINERLFRLLGDEHGVQKKLADHLGKIHSSFSNKTITAWKKRNSRIPAEYIPEIAEFLGVSIHYLLSGDEGTFGFQKKNKLKSEPANHMGAFKNTIFKLRTVENPSPEYLRKIAEFLSISELYFQAEEESIGFFSQNEIDFMTQYRNSSETVKKNNQCNTDYLRRECGQKCVVRYVSDYPSFFCL